MFLFKHNNIITPDSGFRPRQRDMFHGAAVIVRLTRNKPQGWKLVEGLVVIGIISAGRHPLWHRMAIFGPTELDERWVEMIHKTDEAVFYPRLDLFCSVDDALRRIFVGAKQETKHYKSHHGKKQRRS